MNRRQFVARSLSWIGAAAAFPLFAVGRARADRPELRRALESSPFVYVSPLRSDGSESTCHAEVWYAWLDDAVVMIVATDRWKSQAIERGLTRARIWVGDHGRWKGLLSNNEAFRSAPSFVAVGEKVQDAALLDQLLGAYETRYPSEIGQWRDKMRSGYGDGTRVLLRYRAEQAI